MRFLTLHAHERELTAVKINRDSDWLFTAAGDKEAMVWDVNTGERIGTYQGGHAGAILCCDIDFFTENLITGGGDGTVTLWNARNGEIKATYEVTRGRVKSIEWSPDNRRFLVSVLPVMRDNERSINIYCPFDEDEGDESKEIVLQIEENALENKINLDSALDSVLAIWSATGEEIYAAVTPGKGGKPPYILVIDVAKGTMRDIPYNTDPAQQGGDEVDLTSIRLIPNKCGVLVASRDHSVRLYDTESWTCIQTYRTDRPINTALFHPERDLLVAAGGMKAQQAALQSKEGKYTVVFYSTVYASQLAEFQQTAAIGFSPINCMDISRDGSVLVCGHHEGDCRMYKFDKNFWKRIGDAEKIFLSSSGY